MSGKYDDRESETAPVAPAGHDLDDLPDPPDWLGEEAARRQHSKQQALSEEPELPELEELAPEPDGADLEP